MYIRGNAQMCAMDQGRIQAPGRRIACTSRPPQPARRVVATCSGATASFRKRHTRTPTPGRVDRYHLWFDLHDTTKAHSFADAVEAYLEHLSGKGSITTWLLERRKLGFGPEELGEFHIVIETRDMGQLEQAFQLVSPRKGEVEKLHAAVWRHVTGLRTALYRDFPDQGGE